MLSPEPVWEDGHPANLLTARICLWIVCGAEEVLIAERQLRGLHAVETHPDYWDPNNETAIRAAVDAHARGYATPESWATFLNHFAKFSGFSRFDEYHSIDGVIQLVGGHDRGFFEGYVQVLQESFRRPWQLSVINQYKDLPVRGRACTLSLTGVACGVAVGADAIGLRLDYE